MTRTRRRRPGSVQRRTGSAETGLAIVERTRQRRSLRQAILLAVLVLAVAIAVLAAHWPALSAEAMALDDTQYLTQNPLVQNPSWWAARRFLTEVLEPSTVGGYYQPLAMISLMLDHALGGRADYLMPFHRTSLTLHVVNTALMILLLYILFGEPWAAAMVGLLFGVHPLTVEPIPWVGERKTLLAAFFALSCLIIYVRWTRSRGWKLYTASVAMYLLAVLSKPTSTPLPLLLLLLDWWPLRRLRKEAVVEKLPFFVIGGISAIITVISQARTAAVISPMEYSPTRVPFVLCHNIIFYLYKILWPVKLSSHYAFPEPLDLSHPMILAGVVGTCLLIPLLVISLKKTRAVAAGWLFFFVAIFPTMGVIGFTNVIASDKFAYLPSVGLLLTLTCALTLLWKAPVRAGRATILRGGIVMVVLLLAGTEARATRRHLSHWRETEGLFRYMLSLAPRASVLHWKLGNELRKQGRLNEAVERYGEAIALAPHSYQAHHNLGIALAQQGKIEEAVASYTEALRLSPDPYETHNNLGVISAQLGEHDKAVARFTEAIRLRSTYADAHFNLGRQLMAIGDLDQGIRHLAEALNNNPGHAKAHVYIGGALAAQGKVDQAVAHYREALRINPDSHAAHNNLGIALARLGNTEEAAMHYNQALRINPDSPQTQNNLGLLLAAEGKMDEAVAHYRAALRTSPNSTEILVNLSRASAAQGNLDEALAAIRRALETDPQDAGAYLTLGHILEAQGHTDAAIEAYRRVLQIAPEHAGAQAGLDRSLAEPQRP